MNQTTCFSLFLGFFSLFSTIEARENLPSLKSSLDKLVQQASKNSSLSVVVKTLHHSKPVYTYNPEAVFIPASNTKLFTGGAALHLLGPSFRYKTLFSTDRLWSPTRMGNFFMKGSGDPTLLSQDLASIALKIKNLGIKEVKGDIVVDSSVFDTQSSAPGWSSGDGPIFDKSKLQGFLVDHSCISIRITPAHTAGRKPRVTVSPSTTFLKIDNQALTTTTAHPKKQGIQTFITGDKKLLIKGTIALKSKPKFYRSALHTPDLFAGYVMQTLLKKQGIIHRGKVRLGTTPAQARILAHHSSKKAQTLIKTMMKQSDNLYADALFKTMGATVYGVPGTWAKGQKALYTFLHTTMNLGGHRFTFHDGSGLSRTNKVSASCIVDYLTTFYKKSPFKELFLDSLPLAGVDGTLKKRLTHKNTKGALKAKTGSLAGVSSLSGYSMYPEKSPYVFAILINRKKGPAFSFKQSLEDPLCTLLVTSKISSSR